MDPISEIHHLDLQTVINSVYSVEQQQLRTNILLEKATHEEIIANYKTRDPLNEIYDQALSKEEAGIILEHFDAIAFANYRGGLKLLYDTSPTENALRDTDNTQQTIAKMVRRLIAPDSTYLPRIDHRIIDLHNAYAGTTNSENIPLLNPADNAVRIIGAQCLRSGIADMEALEPWRKATDNEIMSFNLALEAAGGIVFGSMLRMCADKYNDDGSINRDNLSQLLQTVKLYAAPTLSQTDEAFTKAQRRDFGMACAVLEKGLVNCSTSDLKNAAVKGDLHEVLWLLDAFALKKGKPEEYGKLGIISADYAEDRGNIHNLALRRGHDFRVFNHGTKKGSFVQLKSHASLKNDKQYAEKIEVHREEDFHKSIQDPSLITDKLRLYFAWSQANFDPQIFRDSRLENIIMPTVKEAFNNLTDEL